VTGDELHISCITPGQEWRATSSDGDLAGTLQAWLRPDRRCALFFGPGPHHAWPPLVATAAADLRRDLYTEAGEADHAALAALTRAGFTRHRRESTCTLPVAPVVTTLADARLPAGLAAVSARDADEDRLRRLDDAVRQDIPGTDGWRWEPAGFHAETFCDDFDPETYLIAVDQASGQYAGLLRVWLNPAHPRLGCIGILPPYRRRGLAQALLRQVSGVLAVRGLAEVALEIDDTNQASRTLFTTLGARRTGGTVELIRRHRAS